MDLIKIGEKMTDRDGETLHLWSVLIRPLDGSIRTVMVLAKSKEEAVGQARCRLGCSSYEIEDEFEGLIKAHATQVPLVIQGWGKNEF